jgi:autotransporter adhesin
MNRVFRRVWCRARGMLVVASELARSRGRISGTLTRAGRLAVLALLLGLSAGGAWAQEPPPQEDEETTAEPAAPDKDADKDSEAYEWSGVWSGESMIPTSSPMAMGGGDFGFAPMSVIEPPPATNGTLPGLVQFLTSWVVGGDYQACGALSSDCLRISGANFDYSFLSLVLNLLQLPNVLDLDGNRPAPHLTLIGAVHSDSYIQMGASNYFGNNNDPDCILIGIACSWQTRAAQNYQVIIGDGGYANGSNTVVIGTDARHQLPVVNASDLGWTGGPDGNYDARLGNAVVIGHGASGTADRQTILGARASSSHANSVALGADSVTVRGAQAAYLAPGFGAVLQSSAGEVSIGAPGALRQLTNVAAGSAATDAVNVAQMLGAIAEVNVDSAFSVRYDDDGSGNPDYGQVTLAGAGGTVIGNVAAGEVSATSDEAVNGAQLHAVAESVSEHLGGGSVVNIDGTISAPTYVIQGDTYNTVGDAFEAIDIDLDELHDHVGVLDAFAVRYADDGAGNPDYSRITLAGAGGTAIGNVAAGVADDEAVNVGQLSPAVEAFGGGAVIDPVTGAVTGPTYVLDDGTDTGTTVTYTDVGSALENLDGRVTTNTTNINNILNGTEGLVRQDPGTLVVTVAGHTGGTEVSFANVDGDARRLTGVADGVDDTDAANMGQLRAVEDQIGDLDALAVKYDDDTFGRITLAGAGGTVIGNVAAGEVSATSDEAVNGAQLHAVAESVSEHLGGGSVVNIDGTISAPTYVIQGDTYNTVGDAFEAIDIDLDELHDHVGVLDAFAVRYADDGAGNPDYSRITLAGAGGTAIGNVAAGVADDEAVNVGQLSPAVEAFGGGAVIDPVTGAVTGPTYVLDDGTDTGTTVTYTDVGSALENLDGRVTTNTTNINNILNGTEGLVRQDPGTLVVTVAGHTGGTEVSFANVDGDARRLTGVADGVDDTDAANMGQLRAVEDQIGDLDALAVKYDDDTFGRITLAGAGGTVIGNVAAGEISFGSMEAINGAQLYRSLERIAAFFGGGTALDAVGALMAPTYMIQGTPYDNVGDALAALDGAINELRGEIPELPPPSEGRDPLVAVDGERDGGDDATVVEGSRGVAIGSNAHAGGQNGVAIGGNSFAAGPNDTAIGGNARVEADGSTAVGANTHISAAATNAVAVGEGASVTAASGTAIGQGSSVTAENAVALGQGSVADQADTVSVGSAGNERRITNVRAGVADTDAVNVRQLNAAIGEAVEIANNYTDMRFEQINADIWEINRGYRAGVASAIAVAGLPQAYMPGKSMLAVAVGGYKQEGALAIGLTTISENGRWVYKFSGTTNTVRDVGISFGAGIQW